MITLEELQAKKALLESKLRGLRIYLAFPELTDKERTELSEAFADRTAKHDAVTRFIATEAYLDDKEIASEEVIAALKRMSDDVALVPLDFESPQPLADKITLTVI